MLLEHVMKQNGVDIPKEEEGAYLTETGFHHQHENDPRKYIQHETFHLGLDENEETDVPMHLLTADEKVDELSHVLENKDS